jgi:hypothetical protein
MRFTLVVRARAYRCAVLPCDCNVRRGRPPKKTAHARAVLARRLPLWAFGALVVELARALLLRA